MSFAFIRRRYIRKVPHCLSQKNFHVGFKSWVDEIFVSGPTEDDWMLLEEEDSSHPYDTHPLCYPMQIVEE